jgi:hypothetical protein
LRAWRGRKQDEADVQTRTLQALTTIRGNGTTPVIQSASSWLDLEGFGDAVFFLQVSEVTPPGAGVVQISYETSPTCDGSLFAPLVTLTASAAVPPVVSKVLLSANPAVPLSRYLRWKLVGTQTGTWDITFRVAVSLASGNQSFMPTMISGCIWWLRADQGITVATGVSQWNDLSGAGDANRNATQGTPGSQPPFTPSSAVLAGQPAVTFTANSGESLATGAFSVAPSDPCTVFFAGKFSTATTTRAFSSLPGNNDRTIDYNAVTGKIELAESALISGSTTPTTAVAVVGVYNGASSKLFVSAKTAVATGNAGSAATVTGFTIGNVAGGGGLAITFGGDMGEMGAFGRALSDTEVGMLLDYMGRRYGIAIGP